MHALNKMARLIAGMGLIAAIGCSSGGSAEKATTTTTAPPTTSTTVPTTTSTAVASGPVDVSSGQLPPTPLTASLGEPYASGGGQFDEAKFGVAPGAITASWYRIQGFWAVHYKGLDAAHALGKCPGNSVKTVTGFDDVSNSPYGANACAGFTAKILPPGSLRLCGTVAVVYTTQIPVSVEGDLFGSLEQGLDGGVIQGITSHVTADATKAPVINVSGCDVIS